MLRFRPRPFDRLAMLGGLLLLPGCSGFGVFLDDTHSATSHVNRPIGNSEVVRRVEGQQVAIAPLAVEQGNVWPGPVPPEPTLEDLQSETPKPLPDLEGATIPSLANVPGLNIPVIPHHFQPRPGEAAGALGGPLPDSDGGALPPLSSKVPPAASPQGSITQTPNGAAVGTKVPSGIPQANAPALPGAIVVPNGNGTSTVIKPDGSISTIPTPKQQ